MMGNKVVVVVVDINKKKQVFDEVVVFVVGTRVIKVAGYGDGRGGDQNHYHRYHCYQYRHPHGTYFQRYHCGLCLSFHQTFLLFC